MVRWFTPGLIAITLAALVGRFTYLIRSRVNNTASIFQGDAFWYSTTAQNLAKGKLFLNAFTGNPTGGALSRDRAHGRQGDDRHDRAKESEG